MTDPGLQATAYRIFAQALDLPADARQRYLDAQCADAPALRAEVLGLLEAAFADADATGNFRSLPPAADPELTDSAVGRFRVAERIGPYALVRRLGAGGMAEVWLAHRADGAYRRTVALKLPMLEGVRADLARRFAHERDILAGLEHPNIARLYDAGIAADGLPYLAMEYVPGGPITTWCQQRRLGLHERLWLFLQVLSAVQYAHAARVIHRDLKPSNILVTESGEVRLLDFGIARLLPEDGDPTQLTQRYARALTPDYASPEHLVGEPVTTAGDIYSLGVVLYELLAGSRPYRLGTDTAATTLEQAIGEVTVARPSAQVTDDAGEACASTRSRLAARLRGDLDAIVLKALARAPGDRYASAAALAEDLRRYLRGEPVAARRGTALYRAGKFVRRHRAGVATGALAAALAIAAVLHDAQRSGPVVAATDDARRTMAESAVPETSIAVLPFLDMSENKDQEYLSDGLAEELLNLLSRVRGLNVCALTSAFAFKGKSEDIPTIARKLRVATVLEGSVRRSGNTLRVSVRLVGARNGYQLWSQTYERQLADVFTLQDEIAASVAQALKVSLLQGTAPKAASTRVPETYSYYLRAVELYRHIRNRADQQKAIGYARAALALDPSFGPAWELLSIAIDRDPDATRPGEWDEARQAAAQALRLSPELPASHVAMARVLLLHDWDWAAGQAQLDQALALDPGYAFAMAWSGDLAIAKGHLDEGLRLLRQSLANDPANPYRYWDLSLALEQAGKLDEAIAAQRARLELLPGSSESHAIIGEYLLLKGNLPQALAEVNRAGEESDRLYGQALVYHAMGRNADADRALSDLERRHAAGNAYPIAAIHAFRGDTDQAFSWLDRAYRERAGELVFSVRYDPILKNIRPDPRFTALLRRMNLLD